MKSGPDFIVIGAMKCATSTLHDQLAVQPGIFMTTPKEPCFFSDDAVYQRGIEWYRSLFAGAAADELCGESSTHYTKLPTYPHTIERMLRHAPDAKLIYVMRHPIDRLVSQYVHEWSQRMFDDPIDAAIERFPILIDYSRYAMQLRPFLEAFGPERVLPVFFERLTSHSQDELARVCRYIGWRGEPVWRPEADDRNVSSQRLRKSKLRDAVVNAPVLKQIRRWIVPKSLRDRAKGLWTMKSRPVLSDASIQMLTRIFDDDLKQVGDWLGIELRCENFTAAVTDRPLDWVNAPRMVAA